MMDLAHDRLVQLCEDLKLHGVADGYAALAAAAAEQGRSFTDYLEAVLQAERDFRRARSAATMVRMAGFPAVKTLESYDFKFATSAPKRQIEQLAALSFVARKENVVFLGPSGVGKTQVSIASRVRCHGEVAEAYGFAEVIADRTRFPARREPGQGVAANQAGSGRRP
uniref:IstB-like ATP-binding domain-containing protein n=1 Tax=Cereibacter sphaeroides (strain ATCC 17025 / ATH 2.4.3) TaxID=349102 RepID=A4WYG7_CERS5